ncbi:MAG TPA: hypothetical protein PKW11_10675 [Pseudomonadota bacterium]|jgi:hypothetical protein|nr:hypothetical protein [Pseudomonadota bacterium]
MGSINLSNSKNRDAVVATRSVSSTQRIVYLDDKGRTAKSVRVLRAPVERDLDAMLSKVGGSDPLAALSDALVKGDPEVDLERTGGFLRDTSRVYVGPDQKIVHAVSLWDVVKNPDGTQKDRRPHKTSEQNVATETPIKWSGKLLKKSEVWNKFVFSSKLQVVHINGLTYDFLFEMAKELEQKESLLLVGAGPKSNQPLVFQRGGTQYRGFLEGRTKGDSYLLILHLSNLELKAPSKEKA